MDGRVAHLGRVVGVDDGERAGFDCVMLQSNREDVGIDARGKVQEDLESVQEVGIDVDSNLRRGLKTRFFNALPLLVVDWANKRLADLIFGGWDIADERRRILLNK